MAFVPIFLKKKFLKIQDFFFVTKNIFKIYNLGKVYISKFLFRKQKFKLFSKIWKYIFLEI